MCTESKRLTPFKAKTLTAAQKQNIREGQYATYNFTNHEANLIGLASWTPAHKEAWELARMEEMND